MTREEKNKFIEDLSIKIKENKNFYIADVSDLNSEDTSKLRRAFNEGGVTIQVVKNTFLKKALEKNNIKDESILGYLHGSSSVIFSDSPVAPAKAIKKFRTKHEKPLLKVAYIEDMIFLGDSKLDEICSIKSKEEVIADIILMLQSPIKNVISILNTPSNKLASIIDGISKK